MHVGRMSLPDNTPHHRQPVGPSAIAPGIPMFTVNGMLDIPVPRELSAEEIKMTVQDFRKAAAAAIQAGADELRFMERTDTSFSNSSPKTRISVRMNTVVLSRTVPVSQLRLQRQSQRRLARSERVSASHPAHR